MTRDLLSPRPYQREALDAVTAAWAAGVRRPAVLLPTGMGKTVVFSHLVSEHHAATGRRAGILVHRDELADQAVAKLRAVAPHLYVGKVKAKDNEVHADVVVASVQTLARGSRLDQILQSRTGTPGLWVTDECHHAVAPTYQRIYARTANALHVGFTATMARSDRIGLGSVWDDVVSSKSIAYAIKHGYLVPPRGRSVHVENLDLGDVRTSRGDYQSADLGDALENSAALSMAADAYVQYAKDRPGIAFTPTVDTAKHLAAMLTERGLPAAVVHGGTPRSERIATYEAFRTGAIRVLCNCAVLTEGFDAPHASAVLMLRPTKSNPLYVQMVGRVLRPFPGKADALVIDVVGAGKDNKLVTLIDLEEGLWPEQQPCGDCLCLPCECRCAECGWPKVACVCPKDWTPPVLQPVGTGQDFELFTSSRSAWHQTPAGVWFIDCGPPGYVFLWPDGAGAWTVYVAPLDTAGQPLKWRATEYQGLSLDTAMTWAEAEAEDKGAHLTDRTARWRKSKATDSQVAYARRLGCVVPEGANKGQVGDLISTAKASKIFDPYVGG